MSFTQQGINYTELIPVLIKAMQEQQTIIDTQNQTIISQSQALDSLLNRVEALEAKMDNTYSEK